MKWDPLLHNDCIKLIMKIFNAEMRKLLDQKKEDINFRDLELLTHFHNAQP